MTLISKVIGVILQNNYVQIIFVYVEICVGCMFYSIEYISVSDAAKDALWLGRVESTFWKIDLSWTSVVYNDNRNPVHHNASKHIIIWFIIMVQ